MPKSTPPRKRPTPASRNVASKFPGNPGFDLAADAIRTSLDRAGMTTAELAHRSGVSRVAITYWINGQRPLRADYLLALMSVLGLEIAVRPDRTGNDDPRASAGQPRQ